MKKTWVRKTLSVGILAAGALLLAPAAMALAGTSSATGIAENRVESASALEFGFLDGSQVGFGGFITLNGHQVAMPISTCGNSLALLGAASSFGTCSSHVGGGDGYADGYVSQAVTQVAVPVRKHFVRTDNYSSCSTYVVASPCGGGSYGVVDDYDYGYDYDYGVDQVAYAEPVVDGCGSSLGVLGYASAYGTCGNYADADADVVYGQAVQYVEPIVPVYTTPAYVLGGSDCVQICGDTGSYGYGADVQGQAYVKAPKQHMKAPKGNVRGDQGYGNKGDVRGDQDDVQDGVRDGVQDDKAGYDKGGARDKKYPADTGDAGYVSPDQYGAQTGGRSAEKFSATGLTRGLSGLGTLQLLGGLR